MPNKGEALNQRVWKLFERAGFETKPNSNNPAEDVVMLTPRKKRTVDLFAEDKKLGVKIIGWNKARIRLNEALTVHINDYRIIKDLSHADTVLFVASEIDVPDEDKEYAEQSGMNVWGKEDLAYYEALVDAIGEYAKYEIIHSLGMTTSEETQVHNVLALHFRQPYTNAGTDMFLFTINPEKLLKTCVVLRRAQGHKDAYQRILKKTRLGNIRKFLTHEGALLPPNIIVHFSDAVRWDSLGAPETDSSGRRITLARRNDSDTVVLSIPLEYASLEIIDGQHRLFGFVGADPATREHFNLVVLGMANVLPDKRTDTFVKINDTAKRVDANLVAYLKYTEDEASCQKDAALMAIKVVVELNKVSPFRKKIRLLDVGEEKITLKGFAGYDLKGLLGEKGLLRRYYSNESKEYVAALRLYFSNLKSLFPKQWSYPGKYIIFTNRGISALLKLLKSILKTTDGKLTQEIVCKYLQPLRDGWNDEEWETKNLQNAYVGSKGWKDFHRELVQIIKKRYPEFVE